ncbi:hypothetical protein Tco_0588236 [Tanacetum coccineum]
MDKAERSKGIELLSDVALLEEDQLKKAFRRSKRETTIHQACGSSEGANFESEVPDEPKADSSESENESWGDNGDKADEQNDDERTESGNEPTEIDNPKTSDDEEETQDDEFVHTPKDYVLTTEETNDESNDVTKEEYERINEELYGDVNVSLTDAEPANKEKDDVEMIVVGHVNVNQEGAGNQVKDDAQATQKTDASIPSSSISSDHAANFLNLDNTPPNDTKVISMMDINVQHEVPRTSSLLTIPVFVIHEQDVINQSETVTTSPAPTISSLISSLYPALQQIVPILKPTTTEATTSTIVVPDTETLTAFHQRIDDLEKDVKELKDVDNSTKVISTIQSEVPKAVKEYLGSSLDDAIHKIEHARKQQVPKETITSSDTIARAEFDQKTTLFKTMTKSKSFNKSLKQRALYHALMESILEDKDAMDEGVADKLKKRKPDDADLDKGPSLVVGFRQKTIESSKGTSKSQPKSIGKYAQAEETVFETGDTQAPQNQGNIDDQPNIEATTKHDWSKEPERPSNPDSDWHVRKSVDFRPPQTWISKIAQAEKPPFSFDELMSTPIDFSTYVMNYLKIDNLTQDHLVKPVFNLLKGTCKSRVELEYNIEECYKAVTDRHDWNNHEGKEYLFDLSKPLPLIMEQGRQVIPVDYFFNNNLEYIRGGSSSKKYTTSTKKQRLLSMIFQASNTWFHRYGFR